jgi:hypothetical protein
MQATNQSRFKNVFSWPDAPDNMRRKGHPMLPKRISAGLWIAIAWFLFAATAPAQTNAPGDAAKERLKSLEESLNFVEQKLAKQISDLMWFQRLADIATIDIHRPAGTGNQQPHRPGRRQ